MSSLQNLLHKKDSLLCLLEASAKEAHASLRALLACSPGAENAAAAQDLLYARVVDRKLTEQVQQELHNGCFDAVGAEDIQKLSETLYKIPKIANKFRERFLDSPDFVRGVDFTTQLTYLSGATEILVLLAVSLQDRLDLVRIKNLNVRLRSIKSEAHNHMLALYRDLFSGNYPAEKVLVLKDLYEFLEKLMERSSKAADIILLIARKNC